MGTGESGLNPHTPAGVTQWAPGKCISKRFSVYPGDKQVKRHARYNAWFFWWAALIPLFHQKTFNANFTSFTWEDVLGKNHTARSSFPQRLSKENPLLWGAKDQSTEGQQEKNKKKQAGLNCSFLEKKALTQLFNYTSLRAGNKRHHPKEVCQIHNHVMSFILIPMNSQRKVLLSLKRG